MNTYEVHCQRCGERIALINMSDNIRLAASLIRAHDRIPHTTS